MTNLEAMTSFPHRGATYYVDDAERIFDSKGKLLGWIASRGAQYAWGALVAFSRGFEGHEEFEFARGHGFWEPKHDESESADPALDAILEAHSRLCGVCKGRGYVRTEPRAAVLCGHCDGKGMI